MDEASIRQLLSAVIDEATGQGLDRAVRGVGIADGAVLVELRLDYPAARRSQQLGERARQALLANPAVRSARVEVAWRVHAHAVQGGLTPLPGVKNVLAVGSGKGGVGKSTVAINLALGLVAEGARVGLLDADIHGPSQPTMTGLKGMPDSNVRQQLLPKLGHGLQVMSIGFLIGDDQPVIWRGPMVTQALMQLCTGTAWDDLDYLVIDLPPGTGDVQLTLCQRVPLSGAVIVTTPQDVALADAGKALRMFEQVKVPVLGIVENMSVHRCRACGHVEPVFGSGGGAAMAGRHGVPLLGQLPLDGQIREQSDTGLPTVAADPDGPLAALFGELAVRVAGGLSQRARERRISLPSIRIVD